METTICVQCKANADWNDAAGYHKLAEECREYCRNGHLAPPASEDVRELTADWPECEDFYNLMQIYRHASIVNQKQVVENYMEVKTWLRERVAQLLASALKTERTNALEQAAKWLESIGGDKDNLLADGVRALKGE